MRTKAKMIFALALGFASTFVHPDALGAWLIGTELNEGIEQSPQNWVESDAHKSGRLYVPLYSREWLDLDPTLRQHVLAAWRELARSSLTPFFNDGARTIQDTIKLAAECKKDKKKCAHPPVVGSSSRHVRGLGLDMQVDGYREDWKVFLNYFQILDANGLYLPLGAADLPHVERQPITTEGPRLSFVDMFNTAEGHPLGTMRPWSREYMVYRTARSHWDATRSRILRDRLKKARKSLLERRALDVQRAKMASMRPAGRYGTTTFPVSTVTTDVSQKINAITEREVVQEQEKEKPQKMTDKPASKKEEPQKTLPKPPDEVFILPR